jgi:hypothetical protein
MDETPTPTDTHDLLAAEDAYVAAEIASDEAAHRRLEHDRPDDQRALGGGG